MNEGVRLQNMVHMVGDDDGCMLSHPWRQNNAIIIQRIHVFSVRLKLQLVACKEASLSGIVNFKENAYLLHAYSRGSVRPQ